MNQALIEAYQMDEHGACCVCGQAEDDSYESFADISSQLKAATETIQELLTERTRDKAFIKWCLDALDCRNREQSEYLKINKGLCDLVEKLRGSK